MHCTLVCLGYDATEPTIFSVLIPLCSIFPSSQWRLIQSAFQLPQYSLRVKNWITSLRLRMLDGSKSFWWISKCLLETRMGAGDGKFCAYYFLSFHLAQDSSLWNWGVLTAYPSEWVFREKKKKSIWHTQSWCHHTTWENYISRDILPMPGVIMNPTAPWTVLVFACCPGELLIAPLFTLQRVLVWMINYIVHLSYFPSVAYVSKYWVT